MFICHMASIFLALAQRIRRRPLKIHVALLHIYIQNMATFLCSYTNDASKSAVLRQSALRAGGIDHVVVFDDKHPLVQTLKEKVSASLDFSWGFWRPYVVHYMLHNVKEGDVVVYCDAKFRFTAPVHNHVKALVDGKDIALFRGPHKATQARVCKQDCFDGMGCHGNEYTSALEVDAGFQMYKKSAATMAFVSAYVEYCSDPAIMDNVYRTPNLPDFQAHHHDQSVLTNLCTREMDKVVSMRLPLDVAPGDDPILAIPPVENVPRTVVVTPTTGTSYLSKCIESVQNQTLPGVVHLIVVDGPEYAEKVQEMVEPYRLKMPVHVMVLPFNSGADGWNGHRIYASMALLLDFDYIAYLDEDNFYDPDHLQGVQELLLKDKVDWTFSLRKILDTEGNLVALDNCESLGNMCHTVLSWDDFLVDTSCYFLSKEVAQAMAPHWMHKARTGDVEADRAVCQFLLGHPTFKGKGVAKHTLNYTVARSAGSVSGKFFVDGNALLKYNFAAKPTVYIFHFNAQMTQQFLLTMDKDDRSYALDEWMMTLLRGLAKTYNLVNGYAMQSKIPTGSVVYVSMCHVRDLPMQTLQRKDLIKILYTIESPNIRHQQQWDRGFLKNHFDHLLTYWTPLLEDASWATFCPHNTHHLDVDNPKDLALLHTPDKPVGRDVVMVLERRDLTGEFTINDVPLTCLDPLRQKYIEKLTDITVYGMGWSQYKNNPRLKIGHTKHRSLDEQSTVDLLKNHTFALILENTTADGYVSEKIYDAFIAGCIPIYYGNNNKSVGIPEDMYIDLKKFKTSQALHKHLDSLTDTKIEKMRARILEKRVEVLRNVSTQAFAERFDQAYKKLAS